MKKQRKPLMLAYIIFLFICIIYNLFTKYLVLDFPMWNRILVGVTIASYFFSLGSIKKSFITQDKELLDFLNVEKIKIEEITIQENLLFDEKTKANLLSSERNLLDKINDLISETICIITKNERKIFRFDVVGYLTFFCVITFPRINEYVLSLQDSLTMIAFVAVLLTEYVEDIFIEKTSNKKIQLSTEIENLLDALNSIKTEEK